MKRKKIAVLIAILVGLILSCMIGFGFMKRTDVSVVNTYEKTDSALVEEYLDNDKLIVMVRHYEMSDGTWRTDEQTYQYRLEITGRTNNAAKDSTFVFLSN